MSDFIDIYPQLSNIIDIGGIRYYMLPGKPIQNIYKSRDEYLRTFGTNPNVERILRQYMGYSIQSKKRLKFEDPFDKQQLIDILKQRLIQLKASEEFSSSILKNTIFQRSYLNIQKIIDDLINTKPVNSGSKELEISSNCSKAKTTVKQIPEDRLFFILLEIAWYLLHPDDVPRDIQCNWAELIQGLDTLRLGEIVEQIKKLNPPVSTDENVAAPVNYFSKAGLDFVKQPKFENALQMIQAYVKKIDGNEVNNEMKDRLKILLNVLTMKKYIDNATPINSKTTNLLSRSLITNPMRGGTGKTIDRPLGLAMLPFFDYFKDVFDPIYSFLENVLIARVSGETIKTATIPQLVTILYICNTIRSSSDTNSSGVYRVTNIGDDIMEFFKNMMSVTEGYIDNKLEGDEQIKLFGQQLFKLPKVRLTSMIDGDPLYKDPDTIPYVRFLILDSNFTLKMSSATENVKTKALKDFFKPQDLYIVCTQSKKYDGIDINIPMNFYEIDFEDANINLGKSLNITPVDSVFDKKDSVTATAGAGGTNTVDTLENFVDLKSGVVYNEAELALSIFILFKQLMPK